MIGLAQQVKCDVLEDVLAGDVDHVELDLGVASRLDRHLFESVFASLRHHVVMVELLLDILMDDLCLADAWLTSNYNA